MITTTTTTTLLATCVRLCALALLFATAALANPGHAHTHTHALAARAGSGSVPALPLNPTSLLHLRALDIAMTNGQRMARGLPPNKPHFRRAELARRARPSAVASAAPPGPTCAPRTGVIHVTAPERPNDAARPRLDGYLSRTANGFGEYIFTADRNDALRVTIDDCDGAPFDVVSSNGLGAFTFLGGIKGLSSDKPELRAKSYNYLYISGVSQTAPHATPHVVGNAFTAATGIAEESESALWSFAQGSNAVLHPQWVNPDGGLPANTVVYVPRENVFALVGDVAAFEQVFGGVSRATFTFQT